MRESENHLGLQSGIRRTDPTYDNVHERLGGLMYGWTICLYKGAAESNPVQAIGSQQTPRLHGVCHGLCITCITNVRRNVDWAQYGKRDLHWDDTASPNMWLAFEYNLSREFPYPPRGHGSALAGDKLQGKGKPKVQSKRHEAA